MRRLALIDDDDQMRNLLARTLKKAGFEITLQATNGQQALTLLPNSPVDVIITDCQMPHMDGITLARTLRQTGDPRPIIMLSGLADEQIIRTALAAGVTHYLTNPLNEPALFSALRHPTPLPAAA